MIKENVSKSSVYFRHNTWNIRYAKIHDNGKKEYGTISGFDDQQSATKAFWDYLQKYREKLKELHEKQINKQQDLYDEGDSLEEIIEEEYEDMNEDYDGGIDEDDE